MENERSFDDPRSLMGLIVTTKLWYCLGITTKGMVPGVPPVTDTLARPADAVIR